MITFGDVISIADGLNELESLDEITKFGLDQLGTRHRNPDMILLIIDLAIRERERVMRELRRDADQLRKLLKDDDQPATDSGESESVVPET
jgi:hypothetical protein